VSQAALLEVEELCVYHGQLCAVDHVSFALSPGETFAVIGSNGAGKSTLMRAIVGVHPPSAGRILFDGEDVTAVPTVGRLARGLALVPEGRRLFPSLSVEENLKVGTLRARPGPFSIERIYELFPWMPGRRRQRAARLSGGEQQAVAIGRALVANPRVLMLDELSLGLAPVVVQRIYSILPELLSNGVTVLLVEQDVSQAMRVASRVHCLLEGRTTLEGRPATLEREDIERAYFGLRSGPGEAPAGSS
jgi:branched-chain amino acid transport system ATP-binding protein